MNRRIFHTRSYSTPVTYSAEAIALFAAMTVPLTTGQKNLVSAQIDLLKADGSWAAADVIAFPMLVTEQQSLLNWKNPGTHNALAVSFASTFVTKTGFPSVAANSNYLRTQYTPFIDGVNWQPSNAKAIVYVKDNVQDDGYTLGGISNGNLLVRQRDTSNMFVGYLNGGQPADISNSDGSGLFSVSTSDGANLVRKRNDSVLSTAAATFNGSRTNSEIFVYCWNSAASPTLTPTNFIDNNTIQCYAFGSSAMNDATFKTVRDNLAAGL
jgi:hypothetical protein